MNKYVLLFAFLLAVSVASSQCPYFLSCSIATDTLCDLSNNNPQFWKETYWYDAVNQKADLAEAAVDLGIAALDSCSAGNLSISFLLKLDLDGDGQPETGIWSDSLNEPNVLFFNNLNLPNGELRAFDERQVALTEKYRFALETFSNADTTFARLRWNTEAAPDTFALPQLPAGRHELVWTVTAADGTAKICNRKIWIRDCKAPGIFCINGLSVNIMPTKMITLWDTDFFAYADDNYTPGHLLLIGLRKKGSGTGFPLNPDGTPVHSVAFDCTELGTQDVEIWVQDKAGNTAFCDTYVIIQDNMNLCGNPPNLPFKVCVERYCDGQALEEATIFVQYRQLDTTLPTLAYFGITDAQGCEWIPGFPGSFPPGGSIKISGYNFGSATTSFADITRLEQHLNGTAPFDNPYLWVAADVNRDAKLDSNDLKEMIRVRVGIQTEWTNNTPWRLIDRAYSFPNPNPLAGFIPESFTFGAPNPFLNEVRFVAVQVGNLNLCGASSVAQTDGPFSQVLVSPNPTSAGAALSLELAASTTVFWEILDVSGRLIFQQTAFLNAGAQNIEVPAEAFPAGGMYFWRLSDGVSAVAGKLLRF